MVVPDVTGIAVEGLKSTINLRYTCTITHIKHVYNNICAYCFIHFVYIMVDVRNHTNMIVMRNVWHSLYLASIEQDTVHYPIHMWEHPISSCDFLCEQQTSCLMDS